MDVSALQRELRAFAATRDWQPYHVPKNLAMALMVEAAELLELFQWQTLAESRALTRNAQDKERVADEIADVLLYLLQLADHTEVNIEEAVVRKMRKNAAKHPAKRPAPDVPVVQLPVPAKVHLLVDWENVQPTGEALKLLVPRGTDVWLFYGPHQKVDGTSHKRVYGDSVTLVPRSGAGKNALDFQLTYYVGYIAARQSGASFVVVSNDQGYDPMLEHARELGFDAQRCEFYKLTSPARQTQTQGGVSEDGLPVPTSMQAAVARPKQVAVKKKALPKVPGKAADPAKASRQDVQRLTLLLQAMGPRERPECRAALLALLQTHLGEVSMVSPRVTHALAQLQAQKRVVLKGDRVSYLPDPITSTPLSAAKARENSATTGTLSPAKKTSPPTAAQVALAVLASLRKMSKNKPTRRKGLFNFIETHAIQAADPKAMAQRVCALLEARRDVVFSPSGEGVIYPKLQAEKTASA